MTPSGIVRAELPSFLELRAQKWSHYDKRTLWQASLDTGWEVCLPRE